jgi:hypothetical protein
VGCHLANEVGADAVVCFGYPLVGQTGKMRDEVLIELTVPFLFLQGTRDRLCPLDRLAKVRGRMTTRSELHVVETGDHSLRITKTHTKQTGATQDDANRLLLVAIQSFLQDVLPTSHPR